MKAKGLTKRDVIQAVRIAARDAAKSPDTNPLLVEATTAMRCPNTHSGEPEAVIGAWNTRALSARDAEIREVLEGLRLYINQDCWCRYCSDGHNNACLTARSLWEKVKPTQKGKTE